MKPISLTLVCLFYVFVVVVIVSVGAIDGGWDAENGDDCGDSYDGSSGPAGDLFSEEGDPTLVTNSLDDAKENVTLKGAIFGFYRDENGTISLTNATTQFDEAEENKFSTFLALPQAKYIKEGKGRTLWNPVGKYDVIVLVNIGRRNRGIDDVEQRDDDKEGVRLAVASGLKSIWDGSGKTVSVIHIDTMDDPETAAEAAYLTMWVFDIMKKSKKDPPQVLPVDGTTIDAWDRGKVKAESQNFARYLSEMPANLMTPKMVADEAKKALEPLGVTVNAHEKKWIQAEQMGSFLSVSHGSKQDPIFLEIFYNGTDATTAPFVIAGKGITFDSGGVSLKTPSSSMQWMRGDMSGGSVTIATIRALALLKVPVNVVGLVPLTENMLGEGATKVMDVVTAKNGKTIEISNTDAEGRLVLADALTYAEKFNPKLIVDVATLTGGIVSALGRAASGIFTRSNKDWEKLLRASMITGDRVWRMPLWNYYSTPIAPGHLADVLNSMNGDKSFGASSSVAAAFLKEFVPKDLPWIHMDIAGTARAAVSADPPYYAKGFTGRPVRTLVQFFTDYNA